MGDGDIHLIRHCGDDHEHLPASQTRIPDLPPTPWPQVVVNLSRAGLAWQGLHILFDEEPPMTTRAELAALSDEALDERIARELMGYETEIVRDGFGKEHLHWRQAGATWSELTLPTFSKKMGLAWQVLQRITRLPQTPEESEKPSRSFIYEWERANLWVLKEQEAARWICETALVSWLDAPYFEAAVREQQAGEEG